MNTESEPEHFSTLANWPGAINEPRPTQSSGKQTKRAGARLFLGSSPKTGRQKKAHARAVALVTKPSLAEDKLEAAHLSKGQKNKKRRRNRRARDQALGVYRQL